VNRDPAGFQPATTPTELMDTDPVSFKEFDDYLRDLERINVFTLAYRRTLLWLKRALADFPAERPISVLDVGSGGGMLRQLRKWAREEFEARSGLARFPGWESPLLRSAKGDRSPAREHVWVIMRGSVVRPTVNRSGGKGDNWRA
jgi:hypothetical protein